MHVMDDGWDAFLDKHRVTPLVCFGSGMILSHIEPLLLRCGIWKRILCVLDNDGQKEGSYTGTGIKIPIMTVETFRRKHHGPFMMLITCEAYEPVLNQLSRITEWEDTECYLYPELNYDIFRRASQKGTIPKGLTVQIPKVIHYCWFGNNPMGELQRRCLESWKEHCPGYEVNEWNEQNYDVTRNRYMKQAYETKKWAFVSDYARLDILYEHGGIYLDTDVEAIGSFDDFLTYRGFIAYGEWPAVNSGAGIGSIKGNTVLGEMRDDPRSRIPFLYGDGTYNLTTNCVYESDVLRKYGLKQNFELQMAGDFLVLPPDYFAPESVLGTGKYITENTVAVHHCSGSWADDERRRALQLTKRA